MFECVHILSLEIYNVTYSRAAVEYGTAFVEKPRKRDGYMRANKRGGTRKAVDRQWVMRIPV